jgi:basic amino acid/polyamine antiporter, APA family
VCAGVWIMRSRRPDLPRGFTVPGYPVTPILSILGCIWIIIDLRPITIAVFLIWVVVVLVWYYTYGIRHSRLNTAGPTAKDLT